MRRPCAFAALVVVVLVVVFLKGAAAAAGPTIVGVAGRSTDSVVLVGQAGEVFLRDHGVWRRAGGGVAASLMRAWGPSATEVFAVGARPPAYQHDGKSWFAVPGMNGVNGPALLSEPGSPLSAVAVGKRIYLLKDKKFTAGPTAPGLPTALWATSERDLHAIIDGKLQHYAGGWKPVPGADESLVEIGPKIALGADGGVYTLDARLRKVPVDPALTGFHPRLASLGKRLILVGAIGDGYAVAAIDGKSVVLLGRLPGLARADEPVGLVTGDGILVVSRSGLVLTGDGDSWRTEGIATAVAETPHAAEPPAPIPTASPTAKPDATPP